MLVVVFVGFEMVLASYELNSWAYHRRLKMRVEQLIFMRLAELSNVASVAGERML